MRKKIIMGIWLLLILTIACLLSRSVSQALTDEQTKNMKRIANVVASEWDTYGVLPSVAVAQAYLESQLGLTAPSFNLWGIQSGAERYQSLEEGIYRYMSVINNGHYPGAPFERNWRIQIKKILDGNYCVPEGNYYNNAVWTIETLGLERYDRELFKGIDKPKHTDRTIVRHSESLKNNQVAVSPNIAAKGSICIYHHFELVGIFDVVSRPLPDNVIMLPSSVSAGKRCTLKVYEEAAG